MILPPKITRAQAVLLASTDFPKNNGTMVVVSTANAPFLKVKGRAKDQIVLNNKLSYI